MTIPYTVLTIMYCAAIFMASGQSDLTGPELPHLDKVIHAVVFGLLAAVVYLGVRRKHPEAPEYVPKRAGVIFASIYAVTDEVHQFFVPNRHLDPADVLADVAGAVLAVTILSWLFQRWALRARSKEC